MCDSILLVLFYIYLNVTKPTNWIKNITLCSHAVNENWKSVKYFNISFENMHDSSFMFFITRCVDVNEHEQYFLHKY